MDDYPVESKPDKSLRERAEIFLSERGVIFDGPVDILSLVKIDSIRTAFGRRRLTFEAIDDEEMGSDDALTSYARDTVSIQAKKSVVAAAERGDPRARMTLAHELGHAINHQGPPLARKTQQNGRSTVFEPHRSAEHQAKVFGAALLMPRQILNLCVSPGEVAKRCNVSLQAAEIGFSVQNEPTRRNKVAGHMRSLAAEIRQSNSDPRKSFYLADPCPGCGRQSLSMVGQKAFCAYCEVLFDNYQDGDRQN